MTARRILAVVTGLLALGAPLAAHAGPVTLKAAPVDTDGRVTLGDLFDGTASQAMVAPGPRDGGSVVLDASRVQAAARSQGLSWANPSGVRRITVRSGSAAAVAPTATAGTTAAPAARAGAVEALTYVRSLPAGAVLSAEDLAWTPVTHAPSDAPSDAEAAIGLAVRKPVRAGSAVSARDLGAARVIAKNDTVSVHYRAGGVMLALQGKALGAAGVGETVRVLNPASKTVVEAVAAAPGLAVVGPQAEALRAAHPSPR
jgi:flagella basal body P-ring formation protein FlgA